VSLLQEVTAAGHLRVHAIHCEQPLSFPVIFRSAYQISSLDDYRGPQFMKYSHVLVMDVGAYPVQLTARTASSSKQLLCPFNCSGNLVQAAGASCHEFGFCSCGYSPSG
jgi:hypothetical protein